MLVCRSKRLRSSSNDADLQCLADNRNSKRKAKLKPTTLTACIINALVTIGTCFYVLALM